MFMLSVTEVLYVEHKDPQHIELNHTINRLTQ